MTTDAVGQRPVTYAPRSLTTLKPEKIGSWTVKRYAVSALRDAPPEHVHDFARHAVEMTLPESYPDGFSYAFSVVHEDADGCYVVVAWWSLNRVILHTRTWLGDWDDLANPAEAPGHATACVLDGLHVPGHQRSATGGALHASHASRPLRAGRESLVRLARATVRHGVVRLGHHALRRRGRNVR